MYRSYVIQVIVESYIDTINNLSKYFHTVYVNIVCRKYLKCE